MSLGSVFRQTTLKIMFIKKMNWGSSDFWGVFYLLPWLVDDEQSFAP